MEDETQVDELVRRPPRRIAQHAGYDNIEQGDETVTVGLNFEWLAEAKLVMTDELIKEMLRQRKAAGTLNEDEFDEIETETGSEED